MGLAGKGPRLTTDALNFGGTLKETNFRGYSDVILTSADLLGVAPLLRFHNREINVIYDSHNVDHLLIGSKEGERKG